MKKTQTHKLKYHPEFEFALLGISSHENDYHLSWSLNQALGLSLTRWDDLTITTAPEQNMDFSVYRYEDADSMIMYHLISNVSPDGFLVPELKNMDFFLQISGENSEPFLQALIEKIKRIQIISACFSLDPRSLKSSGRLLFL